MICKEVKLMKKLFKLVPVLLIAGLLVFSSPNKVIKEEVNSIQKDVAGLVTTVTPMSDPGGW